MPCPTEYRLQEIPRVGVESTDKFTMGQSDIKRETHECKVVKSNVRG